MRDKWPCKANYRTRTMRKGGGLDGSQSGRCHDMEGAGIKNFLWKNDRRSSKDMRRCCRKRKQSIRNGYAKKHSCPSLPKNVRR